MTITTSPPVSTDHLGRDLATPDVEALATMARLISMARLIDELSEQARRQLAARPTVTAHLGHAREHLDLLHRSLHHAEATLAYNAATQPAR